MNRFERPQQINQSKQALSNLLRSRHTPAAYIQGPGGQNPQGPGPQGGSYQSVRQFPRQPMRQQHPGAIQQNQVSSYAVAIVTFMSTLIFLSIIIFSRFT